MSRLFVHFVRLIVVLQKGHKMNYWKQFDELFDLLAVGAVFLAFMFAVYYGVI